MSVKMRRFTLKTKLKFQGQSLFDFPRSWLRPWYSNFALRVNLRSFTGTLGLVFYTTDKTTWNKCAMQFLIENFLCKIIKIIFHSPDFCIGKNFLCFFTDRIFMIRHSNRILALVNCWTTLNMNYQHSCITDVQLKKVADQMVLN